MGGSGLGWTASDFGVEVETRADGTILIRPEDSIADYPTRVTDALEQWAAATPASVFVARRDTGGGWRRVSYGDALSRVRRLAAGMLPLGLSAERPLLIISGNSIEHLLLSLAAMYVGVPYCPVSPAYSQASSDLSKLRYVVELLTPGLVAAFGNGGFERALEVTVPGNTSVLTDSPQGLPRSAMSLADLETDDWSVAEAANENIGPDSIAKFLLTSGSTGNPKPVITTHRMLCSNQAMLRQAMPFVVNEPPVLADWLPWNHTFGGSHNVGLVLFNGGSLYIDDGKPVPQLIAETVRNLTDVAPTVYFNVPKGFELLAIELRNNETLRSNFFSRLRACFFAGAALSQHTWDAIDSIALAARGSRIPILSGLGCTEMSPSVTFTVPSTERAGVIGLPPAGSLVKLVPVSGKLELRADGPHATPGYWRLPEETAAAFDDEGFYKLGDAVRLIEPGDPSKGMIFDGRIAEDFKLANGTWVSTGPLRLALIAALAPFARDVVIAGLNRDYVAILIVPDIDACARNDATLGTSIIERLRAHAKANPGASMHAKRAVILTDPLSIDLGEITDKGSVNQHAVLSQRESLVEDLYRDTPPPHVLCLS